jgi:hypothetical protein
MLIGGSCSFVAGGVATDVFVSDDDLRDNATAASLVKQ